MKRTNVLAVLIIVLVLMVDGQLLCASEKNDTLKVDGVSASVEIVKDRWGISHIYAQSQKDLFFAQGFNAARDRLFQFEIWRRRALGLLSEIMGRKAINHDIGARLLRLRRNIHAEMAHYHPDGEEIIQAFVAGINAYIKQTQNQPELLPLEFKLLGIKPGLWTPEIVVSRHNGLYYGLRDEVMIAQALANVGEEKLKKVFQFYPDNPDLMPKKGIDLSLISDEILKLYLASRYPPDFEPDDIVIPEARAELSKQAMQNEVEIWSLGREIGAELSQSCFVKKNRFSIFDRQDEFNLLGSNNWVISGRKTFSGRPIMANDPHRSTQVPSLRYWVHLHAPGWNVIGGGEPALPGISIGHNEYGAWGLTIFRTDQEDLYVYDTNPVNPGEYRYRGKWLAMEVQKELIPIKGEKPVTVALKYTVHGPVLYEDRKHHKAYAVRASWLEIGATPYLASLRMDQAKNWQEFREACNYSGTPPENMVWADIDGNIGWQAVGLKPMRKGWDGILPVPGDGNFEWTGYLPIKSLPHLFNPAAGHIATANQYDVPPGYPYHIGYIWTDPFRFSRIEEILNSGKKLTLTDNMLLQQDELAPIARALIPLLKGVKPKNKQTKKAVDLLLRWDYVLDKNSAAAAVYVAWERRLSDNLLTLFLSPRGKKYVTTMNRAKMIDWLISPDGSFGENPIAGRDALLLKSLREAVVQLKQKFGDKMLNWKYGDKKYHHITLHHLLSGAVNKKYKDRLNLGPLPRGGYGYTVNSTSNNDNQSSGATFRIIADVGNWDNSIGTNMPGQSGNPDDPHYADLFKMWADGKYFPVAFSRKKVASVTEYEILLSPEK